MDTDKIDSDSADFFSRKRNFDILSRKINKYYDEKYDLYRGNDLKYNNYLRKLNKLAMKGSLDKEGFKDYLKNIKELHDSNIASSKKLGKYLVEELILKYNNQNEMKAFVEKVLNKENIDIETYIKTSDKDSNSLIDAFIKSFDTVSRTVFKLDENNTLADSEFQDLKNLRIAKFAIKLKYGILNNEFKYETKNSELENLPQLLEMLKKASPEDLPLFDKEVFTVDKDVKTYDDMLFSGINKYILSTETFNKYKDYLFDKSFYGEAYDCIDLQNPNIYSINNEAIDNLMIELIEKLKKSYDLNEAYNDEESDLGEFAKNEALRSKKRSEMGQRLNQLREKYGNIDLMYDDYQGDTKEMRAEISKFKEEYITEIESELDPKFKAVFRLVEDKRPVIIGKYDKPIDPEEEKKRDNMIRDIRKKVMDEIKLKKEGKWTETKVKTEFKPPVEFKQNEDGTITMTFNKEEAKEKTQEEIIEDMMREELQKKYLGVSGDNSIPRYDHKKFSISPGREVAMPNKAYPKQKVDNEDEIREVNKKKKKFNEYILYCWEETRTIPNPRKELIKKRFIEYFGAYNDVIYADGYRHYENLEKYQMIYPDRNLSDYSSECIIY
jgi:hypothetical protein